MSKFTRERKKRILEREHRIENLNKGIRKLEKLNEDVQRLAKEHPEFDFDFSKEENISLWKKYTQEYHDTLSEEFE